MNEYLEALIKLRDQLDVSIEVSQKVVETLEELVKHYEQQINGRNNNNCV